MKKIWIVNYYSKPPEFASNPRHLEFSHNLSKAGYDVTIVSAGYLSDKNIDLVPKAKKFIEITYGEFKFIHIKVKCFVGNGINRMFSIFQFAWRLFIYRKRFEKPDVIYHNIHAPFDFPVLWCAQKLNIKYIAEAWDLWPDHFIRSGLVSKNNPLVLFAYAIERMLYEKADKVVFSFEGGIDYLKRQKWTMDSGGNIDINKVYYINNGVNMVKFHSDVNKYKYYDKDLEDTFSFKVIYLGSINLVNNIKQLIDAAEILKKNVKIKFLIYGDGIDRNFLKQYCKVNEINNVTFKEKWIPFRYVPFVLSQSSLNILNYQKDFGLYGISSGKFFQYLASGKPIISNIKMNYCQIKNNRLGIAENLNSAQKYADAILSISDLDKSSYYKMCNRVQAIAKEFDYNILSQKLLIALNS